MPFYQDERCRHARETARKALQETLAQFVREKTGLEGTALYAAWGLQLALLDTWTPVCIQAMDALGFRRETAEVYAATMYERMMRVNDICGDLLAAMEMGEDGEEFAAIAMQTLVEVDEEDPNPARPGPEDYDEDYVGEEEEEEEDDADWWKNA